MDQVDKKIELIMSEMNEAREDDRDAQNQIIQTIGVGGTVLGILTGFSFSQGMKDYRHFALILAFCVFLVMFGYIVSLGIANVIRYHYIQDLEDQLNTILVGQDDLPLCWKSFSSPVMTRNIKHVKSKFPALSFGCITMVALCALFFCLGMIMLIFVQIEDHNGIDWACVGIFAVAIAASVFAFIFGSSNGKKMFQFCQENAIKAREKRLNSGAESEKEKLGRRLMGSDILRIIKYYCYPRLCDLQKPFLILVGYVIGWSLFCGMDSDTFIKYLPTLFWSWFVVDFLVYQARFLWNDIRGLDEDRHAKKTNRIPVDLLGVTGGVRISLIIIAVRIIAAGIVLLFISPKPVPVVLMAVIAVILFTAIFYEMASEKGCTWGVYILVSVGYPVRLLTGIISIKPDCFQSEIVTDGLSLPNYFLILLIVAYGLLGVFSSLLSWVHQAVEQKRRCEVGVLKKVTKTYYTPLLEQLGERYRADKPLKEVGKLSDGWNVTFIVSVCALAAIVCGAAIKAEIADVLLLVIISEVILILVVTAISISKKKGIVFFSILALLLIAGKAILLANMVEWRTLYVVVCCNQAFVVAVYFSLRYLFEPDFDFVSVCIAVLRKVIGWIVGKNTMTSIKKESKHKKAAHICHSRR